MLKLIEKVFGIDKKTVNANVEIYTWQTCPYCIRAKLLLWYKGCEYTEYKIDGDENARKLMAQRASGKKSVPQIFVNDRHLGGCDDLYQLDSENKLDPLLEESIVINS